jgi:predicted metalloprotease with PDZ domain
MRLNKKLLCWLFCATTTLVCLALLSPNLEGAPGLDPIVYTMRFPAPETHIAEIQAVIPTEKRPTIELMIPVWSPGYYGAGNYAKDVQDFAARTPEGAVLAVEKPKENHWRIQARGAPSIIITYRLLCQSTFVTGSWVGADFAVINGPSTFITRDERAKRPHEVHLVLPPVWKQSVTSLDPAPSGRQNEFTGVDYDTFADSPIVLGTIRLHDFEVPGTKLTLADFGEPGAWDGEKAAEKLQLIVDEHRRMIGGLPFKRYVFLNAFRGGNGGLEHLNSTLLSSARNPQSAAPTLRWLKYVSHEFFHAINVKRLRPIELGPFDYENVPRTPSLWISEGLTTYYGDLAVARSGVGTAEDFVAGMGALIRRVQTSPGRLVQTLEQASLDVGTIGGSGVGGNRSTTVSYYDKGPIAGLLLDAKIRRATDDHRSLDDVMRLEYQRYSGERGFTPGQFQGTASEAAGVDLAASFHKMLATTEEFDYTEMLDWFGLGFAEPGSSDPSKAWALMVRPDATEQQKRHLEHLLAPSKFQAERPAAAIAAPVMTSPPGAAVVEQRSQGTKPGLALVESFEGLGVGFEGPQGTASLRNPSDNSLAVGPDHIFQIVNSRMAIYSKKGKRFDKTGTVLYGPVPTNTVFKGFGGACEANNNGDAVVRYDQLADRWLVVMPVFRRGAARPDQAEPSKSGEPAALSVPGQAGQPGPAVSLFVPPAAAPAGPASPAPGGSSHNQTRAGQGEQQDQGAQGRQAGQGNQSVPPVPQGQYSMCYAVSTGPDPFGPYYRYAFLRPLFPDYPRPAVWPDGYYIPTSTGDEVIQKHVCVADRARMLRGEPAAEQCVVIDGVNFLNTADLDGRSLPPPGAPNIVMAAGGTQLKKAFEDDAIFAWKFHVDWKNPANTQVTGPEKIAVAPYHYLCDGQLSNCVPQPGSDRRLDAQGDKIMARLVYRRIGNRESIMAVHSINTSSGGGGVRWYEFRINPDRSIRLHQQGTYADDGHFRWMASPAMDRLGNIGIGYSFGGSGDFAGQRFAGRAAGDKLGQLTLEERVLAEGQAAQNAMRWEDYSQTAIDPTDDCTIWYVGDYIKKGASSYSSRIGAFRLPGCRGKR